MKEDVTTVSPTLGFIIKTIDFQGYIPIPNAFLGLFTNILADIDSISVRISTGDVAQSPLTECRQGTSEAKKRCDRIGKTTSRKPIHWSGSLMRPTVSEWMIVELSSLASFWKRFVVHLPAQLRPPRKVLSGMDSPSRSV